MMKAFKKLFIACSVIIMFACVTLGALSLQPVKANAATAEISDLAVNLNTDRAKKIRLGTYNSQPITWTVIGYNGTGVCSSENTLAIMADDIVGTERFSENGSNMYSSASADVMNYPMKLHFDALANTLDNSTKNALIKNVVDNWSGYFVPINKNIFEALHFSVRNIGKSYLTVDGNVNETGKYVKYKTAATNNNRCWTAIDTTKIESVELGEDGIYTLKFKPADKNILAFGANMIEAQTVSFGSYDSTDDGVDNPTPIKWKVLGYNGEAFGGTKKYDRVGYITLFSIENRFGKTKYGSDNIYDNSFVKSNITKIADVAFNEKEKLGIVPNEGNDVLWAPEKGIIDNFFVGYVTLNG